MMKGRRGRAMGLREAWSDRPHGTYYYYYYYYYYHYHYYHDYY